MSYQLKEPSQFHRWQLEPGVFVELYVNGGLTAARVEKLRRYLDILPPDAPVEGPHEAEYPEARP